MSRGRPRSSEVITKLLVDDGDDVVEAWVVGMMGDGCSRAGAKERVDRGVLGGSASAASASPPSFSCFFPPPNAPKLVPKISNAAIFLPMVSSYCRSVEEDCTASV